MGKLVPAPPVILQYLHNLILSIRVVLPTREVPTISGLSSDHPPVAKGDILRTETNKPVTAAILANDIDPDGDKLKIVSVSPGG